MTLAPTPSPASLPEDQSPMTTIRLTEAQAVPKGPGEVGAVQILSLPSLSIISIFQDGIDKSRDMHRLGGA